MAFAVVLAGCATTPTYTNPAKGNDPHALKTATARCEKAARVACATAGDGARVCNERNMKSCMESEGWTEKWPQRAAGNAAAEGRIASERCSRHHFRTRPRLQVPGHNGTAAGGLRGGALLLAIPQARRSWQRSNAMMRRPSRGARRTSRKFGAPRWHWSGQANPPGYSMRVSRRVTVERQGRRLPPRRGEGGPDSAGTSGAGATYPSQ
jgi:hypothetical protein